MTDIKPSVDFSLQDAVNELTGFETIALEKKYQKRLDAFYLGELTVGLVFTFEKRTNPQITWDEVGKRTQKELSGFFTPESDDVIDEDDNPK